MAAKGMSTTLVIIVAAVVILVTALVILTIFGTSMTPLGTLQEAKNHCTIIGKSSCELTGQLPLTWTINSVSYQNKIDSCANVCTTNKVCIDGTDGRKTYTC